MSFMAAVIKTAIKKIRQKAAYDFPERQNSNIWIFYILLLSLAFLFKLEILKHAPPICAALLSFKEFYPFSLMHLS